MNLTIMMAGLERVNNQGSDMWSLYAKHWESRQIYIYIYIIKPTLHNNLPMYALGESLVNLLILKSLITIAALKLNLNNLL